MNEISFTELYRIDKTHRYYLTCGWLFPVQLISIAEWEFRKIFTFRHALNFNWILSAMFSKFSLSAVRFHCGFTKCDLLRWTFMTHFNKSNMVSQRRSNVSSPITYDDETLSLTVYWWLILVRRKAKLWCTYNNISPSLIDFH